MYGGIIYGADGLPLKGADGGLIFSDAIAPNEIYNVQKEFLFTGFFSEYEWNDLTDFIWSDWCGADAGYYGASADALIRFYRPYPVSIEGNSIHSAVQLRFGLPSGVRGNLTRMQMRIIARSTLTVGSTRSDYNGSGLFLRINVSDTAEDYATVAEWRASAADWSETFANINAATHDNAQGSIEYRCDFPSAILDAINGYSSDTFYLYMMIDRTSRFAYRSDTENVLYEVLAGSQGMKIGLVT